MSAGPLIQNGFERNDHKDHSRKKSHWVLMHLRGRERKEEEEEDDDNDEGISIWDRRFFVWHNKAFEAVSQSV